MFTDIDVKPANVIATGVVMYIAYYLKNYGQKPVLYHKKDGGMAKFVLKHVNSVQSKFWSFFFVPEGKLQTVVGSCLPRNGLSVDFQREVIPTPDGDQYTLHWVNKAPEENDTQPIVLFYPGLCSHTNTKYVKLLCTRIAEENFHCALLCNRGLEVPCLTKKAFCGSHSADLAHCVDLLKTRFPESKLLAIGVSLGGLIMSRYLALSGRNSKLTAAFLYSVPFNCVEGSASLERFDHWVLYGIHLTNSLKNFYKKQPKLFRDAVDYDLVMSSRSVREYDENCTRRLFGYKTVDDYYIDSRIDEKKIMAIRTPTLCLNANDDAFSPQTSLPLDAISRSDYVSLALTSGGGHVAHLNGINPYNTPFYVQVAVDFLHAAANNTQDLPTL